MPACHLIHWLVRVIRQDLVVHLDLQGSANQSCLLAVPACRAMQSTAGHLVLVKERLVHCGNDVEKRVAHSQEALLKAWHGVSVRLSLLDLSALLTDLHRQSQS